MSGSESDTATRSGAEETSGEDIGENSSIFQPYRFEPEAGDDYVETEYDEDNIPRETLEMRLNNTIAVNSWCTCGHCETRNLTDAREYRCCKEIPLCGGKFLFEGSNVKCITEHWDYPVITNRVVLETAATFLTDKSGRKYRKSNNRDINEFIRSVSYRWIVRWIFGFLGWENCRPLPACIYDNIRVRFSSESTTGYRSAQERQ